MEGWDPPSLVCPLIVINSDYRFGDLFSYFTGPQNYTDVIEAFMNLISQVSCFV